MKALRLEALSYSYPAAPGPALQSVSLEVEAGETLVLAGPNGAGKSTLLLHLNGTLQGEGEIEILGRRLEPRLLPEIRRQVGLVFQDPNDQLFMPTVFDDVAFGLFNQGLDPDLVAQRVQAALEAVGLSGFEQRPPSRLSLGEKKRAALATVLALEPEILVLDEPVAGLDPAGEEEFIALLQRLPATKLIATHNMELAWQVADTLAIMDEGRLVAKGPAAQLLCDAKLLEAHKLRVPRLAQLGRKYPQTA